MHLTYETEKFCKNELMQGDVLKRTPALDDLLKEVHPHFFHHPKNHYFMVLTQSCDLVPRQPSNLCKAPYISIAPVRTIDLVIERHVAQQNLADVKADLPVLGAKAKNKVSEFLGRLFNNNEPGYFFLDAEENDLQADCAAFLNLSIAIKSDLHFDTCLDAKFLQLTDTFQAKLGWLVGQMFSRVGTPDWDHVKLNKKINTALKDAAIWVDDAKIDAEENAYKEIAGGDAERTMSATEIKSVVAKVPTRKQMVLAQTRLVIDEFMKDDLDRSKKLLKRLESDAGLTQLLK